MYSLKMVLGQAMLIVFHIATDTIHKNVYQILPYHIIWDRIDWKRKLRMHLADLITKCSGCTYVTEIYLDVQPLRSRTSCNISRCLLRNSAIFFPDTLLLYISGNWILPCHHIFLWQHMPPQFPVVKLGTAFKNIAPESRRRYFMENPN